MALRTFANENGWLPSDEILSYRDTSFANGHLVVEHGLDNTAVITFLTSSVTFETLPFEDQRTIISLSYNNLADWHLFPDTRGVLCVFNRIKPFKAHYMRLADEPSALRAESFDRVVGRRPNPNIPSLDDALISTVSRWRRLLASEFNLVDNTQPISELFNAIFFIRAIEDDHGKYSSVKTQRLLQVIRDGTPRTLRTMLLESLKQLTEQQAPTDLIDFDALSVFDSLDSDTCTDLISDFYYNRFSPYAYDFSVMSKHALSRIYERYISILRPMKERQRVLFGVEDHVHELARKDLGEHYTPQYIARFFARFIKDNTTPTRFRSVSVIDPACGSGMFLRTLLEVQCDPLNTRDLASVVERAFANVHGVDIEENACKATRLSLCLLYLVLTGRFPATTIDIKNENAIHYLGASAESPDGFDVIIANPPYVRWEEIPPEWQRDVRAVLAGDFVGRPDLYLAFLKIALDKIRPGGFLLFVLPHAFLMAQNAKGLRERIARECWIRHLVDLATLNVFEGVSSYPILLIAERKCEKSDEPPAVVTRCSAFAGYALEIALNQQQDSTSFHNVYRVKQEIFKADTWRVLSPEDYDIASQLSSLESLDRVFQIGQGMNSGNDDVFFRESALLPVEEHAVYVPLLRDREMEKFSTPAEVEKSAFYPFSGGRLLTEGELQAQFPVTWEYLRSHRNDLEIRASVLRGQVPWWRPERPRTPQLLLRPKIVGPHLMLFPRFSLDVDGRFAVSRSPYIFHSGNDLNLLKVLVGILNSSIGHWQISTQSHKYSRGYARVEAVTLKGFKIPPLAAIPALIVTAVVGCVDELLINPRNKECECRLDELIGRIYGIDISALPETSN